MTSQMSQHSLSVHVCPHVSQCPIVHVSPSGPCGTRCWCARGQCLSLNVSVSPRVPPIHSCCCVSVGGCRSESISRSPHISCPCGLMCAPPPGVLVSLCICVFPCLKTVMGLVPPCVSAYSSNLTSTPVLPVLCLHVLMCLRVSRCQGPVVSMTEWPSESYLH